MQKVLNLVYRLFYPERDPALIRSEYGIPNKINFSFRQENGRLVATSPDLPGLITEASTPEELLENVNDAILTYFDVPKRESDFVLNELNFDSPINGVKFVRRKERMQLA